MTLKMTIPEGVKRPKVAAADAQKLAGVTLDIGESKAGIQLTLHTANIDPGVKERPKNIKTGEAQGTMFGYHARGEFRDNAGNKWRVQVNVYALDKDLAPEAEAARK